MAQFFSKLTRTGFVSGVTRYEDHYPGQEDSARMVIPLVVAGQLTVPAIVDTGAPWCILDPEIAEWVQDAVQALYTPEQRLMIRGVLYRGRLLRLTLTLPSFQGESLQVEATVFVPILTNGEIWTLPNFVGLDGFLNRMRFAIDPTENSFYFGPM